MENRLKNLFDYQRFEPNSRLSRLIAETEARASRSLSLDDLGMVFAAGDPDASRNFTKKEEEN